MPLLASVLALQGITDGDINYNRQEKNGEGQIYGRIAPSRICDQAWLSLHIIRTNRGQMTTSPVIILSVRGGFILF